MPPGGNIANAGAERRFGGPPPYAQAVPPEAHESLGSRKTVAEVPLTGLSTGGSVGLLSGTAQEDVDPRASLRASERTVS